MVQKIKTYCKISKNSYTQMLHPKKQVDSKRTTATRINKRTNLPNTTRKIVYFDKHTCKIMQF